MRRITAVAAVLAVLALTGCSGTPQPISEANYLDRAGALDSYSNLDDDALIKLGKGMCESLAKSPDAAARKDVAQYYAAMAEDEDGNGADAAEFVTIAIDRYCPDLPLE